MEDLTLDTAIERLSHQESFQLVLDTIRSLCDGLIDELPEVPSDKLQMHAGRITTYREIISLLEGR